MFRGKNKLDRANKQKKRPAPSPTDKAAEFEDRPKRDWYDKWMLGVEGSGALLVAGTLAATLYISSQNNRDMEKALNRLSDMASAAQTQAVAVQTPHVRLRIEKFDYVEGKHTEVIVKILNASTITLFDGKISDIEGMVALDDLNSIRWDLLGNETTHVIGPQEETGIKLLSPALTPDQLKAFKARSTVFLIGVRITYLDGANRSHVRYLCQFYRYNFALPPAADTCATPAQS